MNNKVRYYTCLGDSVTTLNGSALLEFDDLRLGEYYLVPTLLGKIPMEVTRITDKSADANNNPKFAAFLDFNSERGWISTTCYNPETLLKVQFI